MQREFGQFTGALRFGNPFSRVDGEWRFFYRDFFSMFLRWSKPILLADGTWSTAPRLMRRRVGGRWHYRELNAKELGYILAIENGTHC